MTLQGKNVLVTGSTSGIGLRIAQCLAGAGCNIALTGLGDADEMAARAAQIATTHGVRTVYLPADLRLPGMSQGLVRRAAGALGNVDVLINNAGIQHVAPLHEFPDSLWDEVLAVNLSAAFHTTKAALPAMRSGGWGRIINIASAHALVASTGKAAYVASKHGLVGLTKVTALENARFGITANAICPGWVHTPLVEEQLAARRRESGLSAAEAQNQLLAQKQALLEFTTPAQIAELALFLCSAAAATITGASLSIDGGWTAQ